MIVGTDRVTRSGDVANKIGTYLKALAAHDNGVPFWVALPSSTIDWSGVGRMRRDPDRGARGDRGHDRDGPRARRLASPRCGSLRATARPPIRPST